MIDLMIGGDTSLLEPQFAPARTLRSVGVVPFLKWAGGKRQLLPELLKRIPADVDTYYEPFVGGGAVFFGLDHTNSVISDTNEELINCYKVVRDRVAELIVALSRYENSEEKFYQVRALKPAQMSSVDRAARFIYLNRTCFNGLYRVNRKGEFNVPFGKYVNPDLVPTAKLRAASEVLKRVTLLTKDYAAVIANAGPHDFVYLDPPYIPAGGYADFKRYTSDTFGMQEHQAMAELLHILNKRGVRFMVSNSDTPAARELYSDWKIDSVSARRLINCDATKREGAHELIVINY